MPDEDATRYHIKECSVDAREKMGNNSSFMVKGGHE